METRVTNMEKKVGNLTTSLASHEAGCKERWRGQHREMVALRREMRLLIILAILAGVLGEKVLAVLTGAF